MHLGESVHIDGLGTVTLVAVTPPSTSSPDKSKAGGARERVHVNVNLDPGIQWVGLLVWWQFLRGFPGRWLLAENRGGIVGPGFSTKIHQEVLPRCPVTSLPCPS